MSETSEILENLRRIEEQKKHSGNLLDRIVQSMMAKNKHELAMVHPCVINGEQTLVYERGLAEKDARSFSLVTEFASVHGYRLKEDQRADFIEGIKRVKNNRRANAISVLVLTASLMSQSAIASTEDNHNYDSGLSETTHSHINAAFDFDFDSYKTQDELVFGLLAWINSHSSFNYNIEEIPYIKKVSAREIAEVAFGGELPAAINPENLKIFGLYNFNEGSIYLLDSLDMETNEGKGILLHELVHFLQYQTGADKDARCVNELESLAYLLEVKFLDAHNHAHDISQSHINNMSQCKT